MHIRLRELLEDLRENVDTYLNGSGPPPRDLRMHCLSFCSALTRHHTGEDGDAFSIIAEQFPELRKVILDLKTDHHRIDWILGNLEKTDQRSRIKFEHI
ncbi:MAG: hemerythrin domain-containing protein [Pseudonocardiaceae bacterium]